MAATGSVRLSKKSASDIQDAVLPKTKRNAVTPEAALYGVFAPVLAQAFGASAAGGLGETARVADRIALDNRAEKEAERYARDLAAANAVQERLANLEGYYDILGKREGYLQGDVDRGMGGVRGDLVQDEYGVWKTQRGPAEQVQLTTANQNVLNNDQTERFGTNAAAIKTLRDAGVAMPDKYMGELLAPPGQAERVPITSGTAPLTPGQATTQYGTDEGLTRDDQFALAQMEADARIAAAKAKGDEIEASVVIGANGVAQTTYKGSPEALARNGIDPATGTPVNPKAGAQGGDAPAKPAANNAPFNLKAASAIGNQYGTVTSTVRSAQRNRKVGGAKNSYHLSGKAIDIARKPGVAHQDIEQAYKQAGYKLLESLNEGDHSHFAFAAEPQQTTAHLYARSYREHPSVADVQVLDDGRILVTTKSGKKMVVQNGKIVG